MEIPDLIVRMENLALYMRTTADALKAYSPLAASSLTSEAFVVEQTALQLRENIP